MANVPELKEYIQLESVLTREPLGEFLEQGMGGSINYLLTRNCFEQIFKINGNVRFFNGKLAVDDMWIVPFDCTILDVILYQKDPGTSGTTLVDITRGTSGGPFTSIFSTKPSVNSTAASRSWCAIGQTVTGFVAPVLVGSPAAYYINKGDGLGWDIKTVQNGNPQDLAIKLILQTR